MKGKLLEMKAIRKQFSGVQVLFDVDFDLNYGEVHALVGENGAGKSTLIKVLAGAHKADAGEVYIEGQKTDIRTPKEAFAAGVSTIHQEFNLVPSLDVTSNIFLGREYRTAMGTIDQKKMRAETEKLLERVSSSIQPTSLIKDLGVAEKQMVEICKALSLNAKIVIMDEPTAVLSQKEIDKLFQVIRSIKAEGISTIYISHRLDELPEIADRVSVMRDGHMIGQIPHEEITKETITRMMIGRELKEQFPHTEREIGDTVLKVSHLNEAGVLEDISFELRAGEILGFSGLVGAGRTELVRAIVGIDKFESGEIELDGKKITPRSALQTKKEGIVMVPEERKTDGLVLPMTMRDNIALPYIDTMSRSGIINQKRVKTLCDELVDGFSIKPNNPEIQVRNMSGGNQQKVAIAKWVYQSHKIMIFDEPTRGVDVGAKAEIYKIIQEIAQKGVGIIMVSSDLPEILGMCDRVVVMKEGRVSGELSKQEMSEHAVMQLAF